MKDPSDSYTIDWIGFQHAVRQQTELSRQRNLQPARSSVRNMPRLSLYFPSPMGITPLTGKEIIRAGNLFHFNFRGGTFTRHRRTQAHISEVYQTRQQGRELATSLLRLYGIRLALWPTALPRHLLQQADYLREAQDSRGQNILDRSINSRPLESRLNIFKGLSLIRPGHEHHEVRSQLHFERQMADQRILESKGMGPHVSIPLPGPTRAEISIRRARNQKRRATLRNPGDHPGQIQNGWQNMEDTTPHAPGNRRRNRNTSHTDPLLGRNHNHTRQRARSQK